MLSVMQDIVVEIETAIFRKAGHYVFARGPSTYCVVLILWHSLKAYNLVVVMVA
jgi:hypothetical protein